MKHNVFKAPDHHDSRLHLAVWVFLYFAHVLVIAQFMRFEFTLLRSLANVIPMALVFYLVIWLVNEYYEKQRYVRFGLSLGVLFLSMAFIRSEVNSLFPDFRSQLLSLGERSSWFVGALLTNLSAAVFGILYQSLNARNQQEKAHLVMISEHREAQLKALRSQINPHFLFNTLNNIYSLAVVRSEKTADMVLKLSNLLRYVIYESKEEQIELQKEIVQIQEFIALFQMKREQPLDITFEKQTGDNPVEIEPMILIPLVENCFKHCDFETNELAFTRLHLSVNENDLHFNAVNSKNDLNQQKDEIGGIGLDNIRKRMQLKYPNRHQLNIIDEENLFTVNLTLPLHRESH